MKTILYILPLIAINKYMRAHYCTCIGNRREARDERILKKKQERKQPGEQFSEITYHHGWQNPAFPSFYSVIENTVLCNVVRSYRMF
jgi:hypothetical protein